MVEDVKMIVTYSRSLEGADCGLFVDLPSEYMGLCKIILFYDPCTFLYACYLYKMLI